MMRNDMHERESTFYDTNPILGTFGSMIKYQN